MCFRFCMTDYILWWNIAWLGWFASNDLSGETRPSRLKTSCDGCNEVFDTVTMRRVEIYCRTGVVHSIAETECASAFYDTFREELPDDRVCDHGTNLQVFRTCSIKPLDGFVEIGPTVWRSVH